MIGVPSRNKAGEFSSQIPHFLDSFLSKFETAIPKGAQWALRFETLDSVVDVILRTLEEREPQKWNITNVAEKITKNPIIQTDKSCLFAQAVEIPGESTVTNPEGLQMNGYLRTSVGGGRVDYTSGIKIAFLETNYSFVDTVIRPWVITTGHLGLIARPPEQQYRCNIYVYKLGVRQGPKINSNGTLQTPGTPPEILQKYTFYNACPVAITGEEYNYSPATGPVIRETTFIYDYYSIDGHDSSSSSGSDSDLLPAIGTSSNSTLPV
jgi:hypothetical protein